MFLPDTTLDISVERHMATKGVPASKAAVARHDAARIARLEDALRSMRGWVSHWDADRTYGLPPTEASLRLVAQTIDAALAAE